MKRDLTIEIPKKFKKNLSKRFSAGNFIYSKSKDMWINKTSCKLCKKFYKHRWYSDCSFCPFRNVHISYGCIIWISKIIPLGLLSLDCNELHATMNRKQLRRLLNKLKKDAKKYIKWV